MLISKTTVDSSAPKPYDYDLTLTFRVTTWDKPIDPELAIALNRIFDDWCDGRMPFNVEMVLEGLHFCMKNAAYQVVQKAMSEKYGNEMVPHEDGKGATSKAYLEAQKVKLDVPYLAGSPDVRIERRLTRAELQGHLPPEGQDL